MRTRARATLFCLLISGALTAPAYAQPAPQSIDKDKAAARELANEGQGLYEAGKYEEALAAFRKADERFSAPTIRMMIARTHDKLGRLIEARAAYKLVVDEKLERYAPAEFFEAQAEAKREMEALDARIPTLQVTVTGAPASEVRVAVDGRSVSIGRPLVLDPGEHKVIASAPGRELAAQRVTLQEGAKAQVALALLERPTAAAGAATPEQRGYVGPAIAAFGVAGLALGIGAVTGALTLGRTSALADECRGQTCYDNAGGGTYDSAQTLGTVSTVSFVVGGIAAAAGVALLVWPRSPEGAQVGVLVGPGWTGVRADF